MSLGFCAVPWWAQSSPRFWAEILGRGQGSQSAQFPQSAQTGFCSCALWMNKPVRALNEGRQLGLGPNEGKQLGWGPQLIKMCCYGICRSWNCCSWSSSSSAVTAGGHVLQHDLYPRLGPACKNTPSLNHCQPWNESRGGVTPVQSKQTNVARCIEVQAV